MTTLSWVLLGVAIVFTLFIVAASFKGKSKEVPTTTTVTEIHHGEHTGHSHTSETSTTHSEHHTPEKKSIFDRIWEILVLLFALVLLFMLVIGAWKLYKLATTPTPRPIVIEHKIGKEPVLHYFDDTGCVNIQIRSSAKLYPKGGEVEITPPPPGKPWCSIPGEHVRRPTQRAGIFKACRPKEPGICKTGNSEAWGVEDWQ